jgi:hypothetical protein
VDPPGGVRLSERARLSANYLRARGVGQYRRPSGGTDFYTNFAQTSALLGANGIQLTGTNAANSSGDQNATYFQFYYSLNNLGAWEASTGSCVELVLVGTFRMSGTSR